MNPILLGSSNRKANMVNLPIFTESIGKSEESCFSSVEFALAFSDIKKTIEPSAAILLEKFLGFRSDFWLINSRDLSNSKGKIKSFSFPAELFLATFEMKCEIFSVSPRLMPP